MADRVMIPPPATEPPPPPPPPGGWPRRAETAEFEVTVINRSRVNGMGDLKQTTSGSARTTAAWLRAVADEIDPRRPVTRSGRQDDL